MELSGISKVYPGRPPVAALDDVSLRIDAGELLAIVGPSGSGKSTLLHVMGTLDRPTSGSLRIAGVEVSTMSDRRLSAVRSRMIGFVFQQFFLLDGMTAADNVADGLLYQGVVPPTAAPAGRRGPGARRARVTASTTRPSTLSGGSASGWRSPGPSSAVPPIVLADEPTGNLDTPLRRGRHGAAHRAERRGRARSS